MDLQTNPQSIPASFTQLYAYFKTKFVNKVTKETIEYNFIAGIIFENKRILEEVMHNVDLFVGRLFSFFDSFVNKLIGSYIQDISGINNNTYSALLYKLSPVNDRSYPMIITIDCSDAHTSPLITRCILANELLEYPWALPDCTVTSVVPKSVKEDLSDTSLNYKKPYLALARLNCSLDNIC